MISFIVCTTLNFTGQGMFVAVVHQRVPDSHTLVRKSAASRQRPLSCAGASLGDDEWKNIRVGRTLQQVPTDPTQLAAYIFNLLSSGNTQSAATAIAQAASQLIGRDRDCNCSSNSIFPGMHIC